MCRRGRRAAGSSSRSAARRSSDRGMLAVAAPNSREQGPCAAKNGQLSSILTRIVTARRTSPSPAPRGEVVLVNKPYGVLCQFSGDGTRPTLADWVPVRASTRRGASMPTARAWSCSPPTARCRRGSAIPVTSCRRPTCAEVEGAPSDAALASLARGVDLGEFVTAPATVRRVPAPAWLWPRDPPIRFRKSVPTAWLELSITEGKHRQVRRMTAAVGLPTLRLIRWSVGPWTLADLPSGPMARGIGKRAAEFHVQGALTSPPNVRAMILRRFRPELPPR